MRVQQVQNRVGGVSANALVLPIIVMLALLHVAIIALIMMINNASGELSTTMQNSGRYTQEATSLLAGSSLLSETSSNYVLMPVTETGEVNASPLTAYAAELDEPRRGEQVLSRFREYGVGEQVMSSLAAAADSADYMLQSQLHAIELIRSVYPLPDIAPLTSIPRVALTEEEQAMTDAQKESAARVLVLGTVYGLNKKSVSDNVNACVEALQADSGRRAAVLGRRVGMLRTVLWCVTLTIIAVLVIVFATLYRLVIFPMVRFVRQIPTGNELNDRKGLHEVRLLASAYNDVLKRRDALDEILRSAAETDALTNLPNRYRFEQYMLESGDRGYSMAVLLFDVNYLKRTNDTEGHLAGDRLIRATAECISACFGENCFRFGGDEFAAVVRNCTPEEIRAMVRRFEEAEKQRNISVSLGYAYTDEIGDTSFRKLLDEADRQMYAQKHATHRQE